MALLHVLNLYRFTISKMRVGSTKQFNLVSLSRADKSTFLSGYLLREHHGVLFEADGRELLRRDSRRWSLAWVFG